jgi:O-antigen/teichoic acid export membrane protein
VTPLSLFIAAYLLAIGDISAYRNYIILNCVAIILGFLGVYLGKATNEIHPVVILVFIDTLVNFLIIKKIISNQIISPIRYHHLKTIYSYALKGYIAGLSSIILGRIENLVIPLLSNVYILGIYSIAKTFYNIVISIPTAFSGYIFGVFCDNERSLNIQICLKIMGLILILGLAFIVFSFYFIDHFLILVFGNDFSSAIPPAKILVISATVFGVSMPINSLLFAIGKPSVPSIIGVIGITSIIIMMFLLIPKYSIMGAAYSSLFGSAAITIMRCCFFMKLLFKEYR